MSTIKFKNSNGEWEEITASRLTTPRTINGVPFDGSQSITIPAGSGVESYPELTNRPQINGVELLGDKTSTDLNIISKAPTQPANNETLWISDSDVDHTIIETAYESALNSGYVGTKSEFDGDLANISNGGLATGNTTLDTVKKVADKAQFAPNENGTMLYHKNLKWFTPTGTISTNGITAISTSSQFTNAMIGAKLTINNEERIISTYISGTQVTVNSAYSQNYDNIITSNWGVYSIAFKVGGSNIFEFFFIDGTSAMFFSNPGWNIGSKVLLGNKVSFRNDDATVNIAAPGQLNFSSTSTASGVKDIGVKRNSAGVLEINDGNTAGVYRDLNLRNLNYYGTLNNASDENLKHDIRPVNDGLEKVCKLAECVKHFEFNNQDIYAKGQRTGFIAQLLKASGFDGHVSEREPANEEEGKLFGWTYKDEEYEDINSETQEVEIKIRRVVDVKGDMVLQVENNFSPYLYPAVAELKRQNDELRSELYLIKQKLGIA